MPGPNLLARLPLRVVLTLPYLVLLLLLVGAVGTLSYRASTQAIGEMALRLQEAIGQRIQERTTAYLAQWQTMLAAAATAQDAHGSTAKPSLALVERDLFAAGALSSLPDNYLYFAAPDGCFVGVQRRAGRPAQLKLREQPGMTPRLLVEARAPGQRGATQVETAAYDATVRPWYKSAVAANGDTWSPVYLDFSTQVPTTTLARARRAPDGTVLGVYGADVPLAQLEAFLRQLDIARHGLAYLVTRDGRLIASSVPAAAATDLARSSAGQASPPAGRPADTEDKANEGVNDSASLMLAATHRAISRRIAGMAAGGLSSSTVVETQAGRLLVAAAPLKAQAGVDWWVVVALRQDSLTEGITRNAYETLALGGLAALGVLGLGLAVLSGLAGDIGRLTQAAEALSINALAAPLAVQRRDELGRLGHAFNRLAMRLASSSETVRQQNESLLNTVQQLGEQVRARDDAEARLQRVADSLTMAMVVVDKHWQVRHVNALAHRFADRPLDEVPGCGLWEVMPGLAEPAVRQAIEQAMTRPEPSRTEVPYGTPGGWLELRGFPSDLGLSVFIEEATERHAAREAVAERQRELQRLASALLTSQSDERRAIARELHDEMGQQLAALRINLQVLAEQHKDDATAARLADSLATVSQLISQVRSRALDLHPAILDDLGLGPALQWLCERQAQRLGLPVALTGDAALGVLPPAVELAAFRIAQEAIHNAARHSGARRIDVAVAMADQQLQLLVADDGRGFDLADATPGRSLGLVSMRERAEQLGGQVRIDSSPERGTTLRASLPVVSDAAD